MKDTRKRRQRPASRTLSVPEAGARYFGIGRNAAYRAAKNGQIPVIWIGGLQRVPVEAMEQLLAAAPKPRIGSPRLSQSDCSAASPAALSAAPPE
jgi:hypothetical protein